MATEPLLGVGSTIGSYRIVAVLGRGGMGVVYRAEDVRLGRHVALKLLSSSLADDPRYRERFLRESRLAASIEHAAILPIYDAGEKDGLLYIAMRFVDGADLAELLRREGPLDPQRAVALVGQLASALDVAHAHGLIHRDIKPSNALIGTDDEGEHAYLVDFGITQESASQERLTATGQIVGTLDYLAPERLRGEEVDGRADIYALGCVLFQCLTGQVPFKRDSEAAAIYAHLEEQPPRPSMLRPGLPDALDKVVARALAKDRADRYTTGADLRVAARAALAPEPAAHGRSRLAGLPRRGLMAALTLVLLVIAGGVALLVRDGGGEGRQGLDGNAIGAIDAGSGDIAAPSYPVGRDPGALAVGGGSVWASSQRDESVTRIEPESGRVVTIPVRDDPAGVAFAAGSLWVASRQGRTVSQIDPQTNTIVQSIEVGNAPSAVAAGFGALWVASDADRKLFRVDLERGKKTADVDLSANGSAVAVGAGAVWVASAESGRVFRVEPGSNAVSATIEVGNGPAAVVATDRAVWVANRQDDTVSRIDPATDAVTDVVQAGDGPAALAVDADAVWVGNGGEGTVGRINPETRLMVQRSRTGASPTALVVSAGFVWAAARTPLARHRGGTLRVRHRHIDPGPWASLEPSSYEDVTLKLLSLAHDGLVAYRRTDSSTYGDLVGALATEVPDPSPDGRTYVFKLRAGLRYSDGTAVRPEDFRASMEALVKRFGAKLPRYYDSILGVPACASRPTHCDLSKGIVADAGARTITLRLSEPDPELLDKLAYPFAWVAPANRPFRPRTPVPGTGPYQTARLSLRRGVVLIRNPHFRARDGRPDGLPDQIRFSFTKDFDANVAAVERNAADAVVVASPFESPWRPARISGLAARAPGRLHTDAVSETEYMFLNVRVPPFDHPRVRQALNYAVDRREIERRAGGTNIAQLACGLAPPGFPGYEPSCRYTVDPSPSGAWVAPDLDRARRLVERSGTKGQQVTLWGWAEKRSMMAYVAQVLRRLGYETSLKVFAGVGDYGGAGWDPDNRVQIGIIGWASDVAIASDFATQFRCSSYIPESPVANQNGAAFCDHRIEARARDASRARAPDADAIWRDVYRMLDEAAPYVALVHRRSVTLVSERVGNYQHHPLFGPLYDQMWVR